MGLINRVVEKEDLESAGMEFAETIAANDMMSVAITKKAINKTLEISGMRTALADASEANMLLETTDYDEKSDFYDVLKKDGIKAALEWRRKLVFGKSD
jgi:enoyl-CoA hydratase